MSQIVRQRTWLLGLAIASTLAGCLLGSFSDLQGGGAPADAASDAVIETGSDAAVGSDANVGDSSPVDATPGVRFCSTQVDAAFCDDFDQVDAAPFSLWQPPNLGTGSSVMLTTSALSAPNALLAGVTANSSSNLIPANVSHQLSGTVSIAHYAYDFLIDFYDMGGSAAYFGPIDERVGNADTEVRLIVNETGLELAGVVTPPDGGAATYPGLANKFTVTGAQWHHVDLVIDYTQNPATVTFTFDSTIIANNQAIPGATFGPGNITIDAGFLYVSCPTSGWKLRVDNVAVFAE